MSRYTFVKDLAAEIMEELFEGGPGSGNWGHRGRPGKRGGSLPRGSGGVESKVMTRYIRGKGKYGINIQKAAANIQRVFKNEKNYQYLKALRNIFRKASVRNEFPKGKRAISVKAKKEAKQWLKKMAKERPPKAGLPSKKYPGFKTVTECETWMKANYPHMTKFTLKGLTPENANKATAQLSKLFDEFPEVAKTLTQFEANARMPRHRWADEANYQLFQKIRINARPEVFGGNDRIQQSMDYNVKNGWHPPGCDNIESVITHEFGHAVRHFYDIETAGFLKVADYNTIGKGNALHRFVIQHQGRIRVCSKYAQRNDSERFAENFAALHHTPPDKQLPETKQLGVLLEAFKQTVKNPIPLAVALKQGTHTKDIEKLEKFEKEAGLV